MIKKIVLNILVLFALFFLPLYFTEINRGDVNKLQSIQNTAYLVLVVGSCLLIYLNHKFRKQAQNKKWVWLCFEILGVLGFIFSAGVLWLLYEFRHGIGF